MPRGVVWGRRAHGARDRTRHRCRRAEKGGSEAPLNERLIPYDAEETARVWNVIDGTPGGREAERAFLRLDLIFPIFYGGALTLSVLMLARVLGANGLPWLTPVVIGVVADWTENTIHLRQFGAFDGAAASLDAGLIQLAGYATAVKLVFVVLSLLLILALPWFLRGRVS